MKLRPTRTSRLAIKFACVAGLLLIMATELALSARRQSQTWDEAYHMLAGYRYWQAGDYGINPEHPPLVKLLAAIPLVVAGPRVPAVPQGTSKFEGFVDGRKFLYLNDADVLLFRSRMMAALLSVTQRPMRRLLSAMLHLPQTRKENVVRRCWSRPAYRGG